MGGGESLDRSEEVRAFLGRAMAKEKANPRHLICDKGPRFWCAGFNGSQGTCLQYAEGHVSSWTWGSGGNGRPTG